MPIKRTLDLIKIYDKLFKILNDRIYGAIADGDTAKAKGEIEVLEKLVKLKKAFQENTDKIQINNSRNNKNNQIDREQLFKELEERLNRIRNSNIAINSDKPD